MARVKEATGAGYCLEIHAFEDAAAESVIHALEDARVAPEKRPIITHCQVGLSRPSMCFHNSTDDEILYDLIIYTSWEASAVFDSAASSLCWFLITKLISSGLRRVMSFYCHENIAECTDGIALQSCPCHCYRNPGYPVCGEDPPTRTAAQDESPGRCGQHPATVRAHRRQVAPHIPATTSHPVCLPLENPPQPRWCYLTTGECFKFDPGLLPSG